MAVIQTTLISVLVALSFCGLIAARSKAGAYFPRHSELAFDDTISEEEFINEMRASEAEANLLAKWPYLRDLVESAPDEVSEPENTEDLFTNLRAQLEQQQQQQQIEQQQKQAAIQSVAHHRFRPVSVEEKFIVPEPLPTPVPYQLRGSISEKRNNNNHCKYLKI